MASSNYSNAYSELRSVEFYKYKTTTCRASVTKSIKFRTVYIGISKDSNYTDEQNKPQHTWNNVLFSYCAAKRLYSVLGGLIFDAEKVIKSENEGVHDIIQVCHN